MGGAASVVAAVREERRSKSLTHSLNQLHYPHARVVSLPQFKRKIPDMRTGDLILFSDPKWVDAQVRWRAAFLCRLLITRKLLHSATLTHQYTQCCRVQRMWPWCIDVSTADVWLVYYSQSLWRLFPGNHQENCCKDRIGVQFPFPPPLHVDQPKPKTTDPRFVGLDRFQTEKLAGRLREKAGRVPGKKTDPAILPLTEQPHEICLLESLPGRDMDERRNSMADLVDLDARVHHFLHCMDPPPSLMRQPHVEKRRSVTYRPLLLPDGGPQRVVVRILQGINRNESVCTYAL